MASAAQMLAAGLSLCANTVILMLFALTGGAVFQPLIKWYSQWHYETPPAIDPNIVQWIFPFFFGLLLFLELVLIYATYQTIWRKKVYQQEFA